MMTATNQTYRSSRERRAILTTQISAAREDAAGMGTRKLKLRLNRLATISPVAKGYRLALEIEDANNAAKRYFGDHRERYYAKKDELLRELVDLAEAQGWEYGFQAENTGATTSICYLHLPGAEQVSWHCRLEGKAYQGEWDGKQLATLGKLIAGIEATLLEALSGELPKAPRRSKEEVAAEKLAKVEVARAARLAELNALPAVTYYELRRGVWGVRVAGDATCGDIVNVQKRDGSTKREKIAHVLEQDEAGANLCTIVPQPRVSRSFACRKATTCKLCAQAIAEGATAVFCDDELAHVACAEKLTF